MEEKIYQKLIQMLGQTSLSERTIKAKAARLAKKITKDEELTDEALSESVEDLKDLNGQLSHDVADKVEKQLLEKTKELEDKYKGKKPEDTSNKFELPEDIKKELEASRKFRQDYEREQQIALEKSKKDKIKNFLLSKEGGCKDEKLVRLVISENFSSESDVATNIAILKEVYNKEVSDAKEKEGFTPEFHGGVQTPQKVLTDEEVEKLEKGA